MNNLNCIGRVGKDAVLRNAGGEPVAGFSVAMDAGYGDKKTTVWLDCSLWGKRAEKVYQFIKKGDRIGVTGELSTREHDGKTYLTLRVADVTLLGEKKAESEPRWQEERPAQVVPRPEAATRSSDSPFPDDDIPF
jgi:single-strand DNA-binding protein